MEHQTLIIVIVAGAVVGLIVTVLFIRLVVHACRRNNNTAPIPPPQPLARHRVYSVASRPQTIVSDPELLAPSPPFQSSRTSLVSVPSVSRHVSSVGSTPDSHTRSDLTLNSPMDPLGQPQPSFSLVSPSTTSLPSSSENDLSPTTSSAFSHDTGHSSQHPLTGASRSRSRSRSRNRSSMSSSVSRPASVVSTNSRHTLRGVPHGPYSNVQIVLPAPLAYAGSNLVPDRSSQRLSMVDSWASLPVNGQQKPARDRRSSNLTEKRASSSSINSSSHNQLRAPSRRSSSSSLSNSPSPSPLSSSHIPDAQSTPPVPRIPSIYNTLPRQGDPV